MATIIANGNKIILQKDHGINEILLDFNNYKSNYSKKKMHSSSIAINKDESIFEKYQNIINKIKIESNYMSKLLIITLIIRELIGKNSSVKMIELGSGDGTLSRYFAEILKYFNYENQLICVDLFNETLKSDNIFETANIFDVYKNNIKLSHANDIVKTIISSPKEILDLVQNETFDIIFVNKKYSNSIYLNKYINKIKQNGLFIVDLENNVSELDKYNSMEFDNFHHIDNKIILYSNIDFRQKQYFSIESIDNKGKQIYKNIFDIAKYIVETIEYIVDDVMSSDVIDKINNIITMLNNMEELFIGLNGNLNNHNLKYETNEVKSILLDLMFEIKEGGIYIEKFKNNLLDISIIWSDSIEQEFFKKIC